MRIIAGVAKGRPLNEVAHSTRPTSDRAREAFFSTLASEFGDFQGIKFLDLYAGTGAIALEDVYKRQLIAVERNSRIKELLWPEGFRSIRSKNYGQAVIFYGEPDEMDN